ncbi:hypothetical protein BDF22DRAFT_699720 [Syncephalis plumigaleata]|nr:hypothetical protein BDF22DRAFT_699720 [Syncephalis plumigaleata]
MLQELTGLRKRLHTTVVPTSLEHIYKQDDAALFDGPCDVIPMFVADQYELDSIDFHISQLKQRPNNVRRLGMAYQRRQIIAALFDPVIRSLASSDSAIRSIWKEEFYGNLATFYNLENETELYRFSFAPALAITIPYDVYRCPLEQRSGLHYQGMARKEVGELGFFIMEMIDDTQCHIRENRIRFFAQMITAVCGQELVSGGLIDAQHAYKPFCTGIILTNSQMQFYLATRREQLDSHFELYHYANCDLYSVDNRGKCYNIAAFAEAAILFRNQVDMTRRHLRHFQSTGGSSGEADSHAADDGFAAYRQVVTRLAELNPLPEFVATGFARASSRDSIGSVSSIDLDKGVANDGMSIDNDDNANEDDAPCRIIAKKSSISLEKRISQIISDTEELQVLVTNYLRNNNLVAKSVHVHKSNPLCFNRVQRKWDFIAHDGQGRQFFVRLSQNQMANAEQIEMSMRLQRSGVLQGRLIMIRHTGYLLGMQVAVTDYVDQRYDFPQNPYELGYYTSELAKTLAIFHDEFGVCYGNLKPSRVLTVNNSGPLPTILINNIGATHIPTTSTTKELNFTSDIVALGQIAQQHMMSGNMQHTELFDLVQNMLTSISNTRPSMGDIVRQLDVLLPELRKQYKGTEASEFTLLERQLSMHDILDKMSNYSDSSLGLPVCRHSRSMPLKKRDRRLVSQSLLRETKQRRLGESDIFGDN